jgi:hypothetical protein
MGIDFGWRAVTREKTAHGLGRLPGTSGSCQFWARQKGGIEAVEENEAKAK